jgi:hypothetical protein
VNHVRIHNVFVPGHRASEWGSGGKLFRIFGGASEVSIQHVTSSEPRGILDPRDARDANRTWCSATPGRCASGTGFGAGGDEGVPTLARNFPQTVYKTERHRQHVQVDGSGGQRFVAQGQVPPQTMIARSWEEVAFQAGTYRLHPAARSNAAEDGRDMVSIGRDRKGQAGSGGSECRDGRVPARGRARPR